MSEIDGTICVMTYETGRFSGFWSSMLALDNPGRVKLMIKNPGIALAKARNEAIRETQGEWLWFMDDDHEFPPGILKNLLARDVDIVSPLCLYRRKPFGPTMMGKVWEPEKSRARVVYSLRPGDAGLKEVEAIGTAGMLIRRRVWEGVDDPWFTVGQPEEGDKDNISEDISFCRRAGEAGFKVFCDLDNPIGHYITGYVLPTKDEDGSWKTTISIGGALIDIPQPKSKYLDFPAGSFPDDPSAPTMDNL